MKKCDLVSIVSKKVKLPDYQVLEVVNTIIDTMHDTLEKGENVYLRGLGTFNVVTRKAKLCRDIRRNKQILSPAHKKVKFIQSSTLIINN